MTTTSTWPAKSLRALVAALATVASLSAPADGPLPVVVSFSILSDWVHQIGGARLNITTLVGPDSDAHVYEPSPIDARAVAGAKLVFINGLGLEGWMARLIAASGSEAPVIATIEGVDTIPVNANGGMPTKRQNDEHAPQDPHAWLSVKNALVYVRNITAALCAIDAGGCPQYTANSDRYLARLNDLHHEIKATLAGIPKSKRNVITLHDAFGYFSKEYAIRFLAPLGMSTEAAASASDAARLIDQIRAEQISGLFLENIADTRLLEQIARETGITPGGKLYSDALSSPKGPAGTYIDMMRHNARTLARTMLGQ